MSTLQDLQRQIESISNTSKMTQAMQTISAVKLSRARARLNRVKPYTDEIEQMVRDIAYQSQNTNNEYLAGRDEVNAVAICSITSDRGLAGAFNAQVLRQTMELRAQQDANVDVLHVVTGNKAQEFFRFQRASIQKSYTGFSDSPDYDHAREIGSYLSQLFDDGEADEVHLIYNRFQNALVQYPTHVQLLPVAIEAGGDDEEEEEDGGQGTNLEFVPSMGELLDRLVPQYIETMIFRALVESAAGEHGARMAAMKSATDAANDMVEDLTQQMNKARQEAITQEIIEISAAMVALGQL